MQENETINTEVIETPTEKSESPKKKSTKAPKAVVEDAPAAPEVVEEAPTVPEGDGFPVFNLLPEHKEKENFSVNVSMSRKVDRNGGDNVKTVNVNYQKGDLERNSLILVGKHPILKNHFEAITEEEMQLILGTPTSTLARIQRRRNQLA